MSGSTRGCARMRTSAIEQNKRGLMQRRVPWITGFATGFAAEVLPQHTFSRVGVQ
ncbi:hypothetical protein [Chloroflexus sp.]|uniref:hypothetical protein n=1 Tax=Chloroflexus sp. TaxID=1904827 RepID=UPI00258FC3E4|nr:hypothetical protein [Chloroflexus sp.]